METSGVGLTSGFVDEILWRDYSNESSLAVVLHGTISFSWYSWEIKGSTTSFPQHLTERMYKAYRKKVVLQAD